MNPTIRNAPSRYESRRHGARAGLAGLILAATVGLFPGALTAGDYVPFHGERSEWRGGFERQDFVMDESTFAITPFQRPDGENFAVGTPPKGQRRCIVVVPKEPAPGRPWSWQACYWDHEPQTEVELLRRGFHIVFITPDPGKPWDAWYAWLTEQHGLSKKPAFIGMSRGGVNEYDWATANPDKVSCIYADNPAIRAEAFGRLGDLAKHDVALLNICGSQDSLLQRHTLPIEARYQQLGGRITVMIKDGPAHHPHSVRDPKPIADWIVEHMLPETPRNRPAFVDDQYLKTYYYSLESTNVYLAEEKTYANCRGPGFTPCYDRFDRPVEGRRDSPFLITGLAVIAPKIVAPGKPWVFRADAIGRDASIDQALLAQGYHIVMAPLITQTGPVKTQWNATYTLLTEHGFSKKPVLEGTGTSAGEVYAWAIENPEKVACVVGRNPALRSLMTKTSPLENLGPLAKAGVPLLHVCDHDDPWFAEYTKPAEQRYKELGGRITVVINDAEGHGALASASSRRAVEFLLKSTK